MMNEAAERVRFEQTLREHWLAQGLADWRITREFASRTPKNAYTSKFLENAWFGWTLRAQCGLTSTPSPDKTS